MLLIDTRELVSGAVSYSDTYFKTSNYTYTFANLNRGDSVKYYIEASDVSNQKNVDPTGGKLDPHQFTIS